MNEIPYHSLIERIRLHCKQTASLALQPGAWSMPTPDDEDYDSYYVPACNSFVALTMKNGEPMLAFALATEKQLRESEQTLGFALPLLLRLLYLQIANGGFGPGYGLFGIFGGFPFGNSWGNRMKKRNPKEVKGVHLEDYEMITWAQWMAETSPSSPLQANADQIYLYVLPYDVWPDHLFFLCDWGCGIVTYLDVKTERIFQSIGFQNVYILQYVAPALEEWLERWLAGESLQFL